MSESKANYTFAFYLGCIAPNRYPGCESAAIKTCKKLGYRPCPPQGCKLLPVPGAFGSIDLNVWYAMAARNLVLAEQMKMDIALLCNGCYKSIWKSTTSSSTTRISATVSTRCLKEIDMEIKEVSTCTTLQNSCTTRSMSGPSKVQDSVVTP